MYAVAADGPCRWNVDAKRRLRAAVPLFLSLAASSVLALDEVPPATVASSAAEAPDQPMTPARLEVSASNLPRFDNIDGTTRASRIDFTWLPPRQPGLRLVMGMALGMTNRTAPGLSQGAPYLNGSPGIDLGFHWRYTMDSQYRIDFTAWRRMAAADADAIDLVQSREPAYGARVEMGLRSMPKSGFIADRGFLGVQLDGGARITLRRSAGRPMLYYRTSF